MPSSSYLLFNLIQYVESIVAYPLPQILLFLCCFTPILQLQQKKTENETYRGKCVLWVLGVVYPFGILCHGWILANLGLLFPFWFLAHMTVQMRGAIFVGKLLLQCEASCLEYFDLCNLFSKLIKSFFLFKKKKECCNKIGVGCVDNWELWLNCKTA